MGKIVYRVETPAEYKRNAKEKVVKAEGMVKHVYVDVGGVPTTANGKALVVYGKDSAGQRKWVIDPAGERILKDATGRGYTDEQRATLEKSADNLNQTRPGMASKSENMDAARKANVPEFYTSDVSTANSKEGYRQRTYQPEKSTFGVNMSDEQIQNYADKVYENTESGFDRALASKNIDIPPSKEREGLVSIYHQNPAVLSDAKVVEALKSGDREKLIQALEDPRLMPKADGLKQRRQEDIDTIGQPDDPDVIRHENNPQAGLDATFKVPPKTTPNSGPFQPQSPDYQPQQPDWEPMGPSEDVQSTQPRPSILDSVGNVAGQIGGAISTVGRATFDMATSLGKETLNQLIQMALTGGAGGKDVMKRAVQLAMGNMIASMQQAMLAEIANIGNHDEIVIPGIAGDIIIKKPTEDVMNAPQNQSLFDQMADVLLDMLGLGSSKDPSESMTDIIMMSLRNGEVKLPGNILLPDIYGKGQVSKDGRTITVFGIPIPVGFPSEVIFDGPPQLPGVWDEAQMFRRGDGKVVVKAHNRGGHPVKEYTRSAPDGDVTNNLSYRSKG